MIMNRKKKKEARKKLLNTPWWRLKQNWYAIGVFVVILIFLGFFAIGGSVGTGSGVSRGARF